MKYLDLTLATPAENLACDEALLDVAESGAGHEVLRFWEPNRFFVVVGYANKIATEVNLTACEARRIPVLRRCSGGGTVLQGPGCLNYALILKIDQAHPLRSISAANRFIIERNRAAIESVLSDSSTPSPGSARGTTLSPSSGVRGENEVEVRGHTDLVISGLKFSGNSQRRRRRFLLFHGSFLLQADLALISELLPMPSRQPDYRGNRTHGEFLTNLNVTSVEIKNALQKAWCADSALRKAPCERIAVLTRDKYATREWNHKF